MTDKLSAALQAVEENYGALIEIANDILNPIISPANIIINEINFSITNMSVEQLRDYILRLQLKAFEISDIKEKSALKAELAEALQKEKFAVVFNGLEGSAAVKDKIATVETSAETVSEALYSLLANLLKTKVDQIHRLVAALSSILMSRMQEMKFMNIGSSNEISPTTNGKIFLNE